MAIALERWVGDLLSEFLAHAHVVFRQLETAGAVQIAREKPFAYALNELCVFIQFNLHDQLSVPYSFALLRNVAPFTTESTPIATPVTRVTAPIAMLNAPARRMVFERLSRAFMRFPFMSGSLCSSYTL